MEDTSFNIPKEYMGRFNSCKALDNRQIRFFLSSTFADMQEERDALIKTFNSLKVEANKRNVALSIVDLRWGVTEEESKSGKVISVCFNEIEHSHPFFIGLLGSRYGYTPELSELQKNPDLKERYPWIEEAINERLSITEMEMVYGALCNDDTIDAAFYIKETDKPDDDPKLTALKKKINGQTRFPKDNYSSCDDLCDKVKSAVMTMLDIHFPMRDITPLDRVRSAQDAYINSRHDGYVRRQSDFDRLNEFVASDERYFVVTGDSGMGKSALMANWIKENKNNEKFNLAYHFVGNSFSGSSHDDILRHLCDEIYDVYGIKPQTSENKGIDDEAEKAFEALAYVDKPLVIVIDGINQVGDSYQEKQLTWLPRANGKVKFIFTTLADDETMNTFVHSGYTIYKIEPLTLDARMKFAVDYLKNVGKSLTKEQWNRIFTDKENENTMVLKTFLDELICFGTHERINERINYYLNTTSISEFYDRVLQRLENDYSNDQDIVRHTLMLAALSDNGLTEDEIISITGYRKIDWNLFYCAIYNHLVEKNGNITFSHQYMAKAVEQRYIIGNAEQVKKVRREIAEYFSDKLQVRQEKIVVFRMMREMFYQYYMLQDWDALYYDLGCAYGFACLCVENPRRLATYWEALLKADKNKYSLKVYLDDMPGDDFVKANNFLSIGLFITQYLKDYETSRLYFEKVLSYPDSDDMYAWKAKAFNNLALANFIDDKQQSLDNMLQAIDLSEKTNGKDSVITAKFYCNLGTYYGENKSMLNRIKSKKYLLKALNIYEKHYGTDNYEIALTYYGLARMYFNDKSYKKALKYNLLALEPIKKTKGVDSKHVAVVYEMMGMIYLYKKKLDLAKEYLVRSVEILEIVESEAYHKIIEYYSLIIKLSQITFDDATQIKYQLKYYNVIENSDADIILKINKCHEIGELLFNNDDDEEALKFFNKELEYREKIAFDINEETADVYTRIQIIYEDLKDAEKAKFYEDKGFEIYDKATDMTEKDKADSYDKTAGRLYGLKDYDNALEFYKKALEIREEDPENKDVSLAMTYKYMANCYNARKDHKEAVEFNRKAADVMEVVVEKTGKYDDKLAVAYTDMAWNCHYINDNDLALKCFEKAYSLRKEHLGDDNEKTIKAKNNLDGLKNWLAQP